MNFFLPIILAFSVSVRTANVQPNPLDYQFAYSAEKKDIMFLSVEHEQELGKQYINEEYWVKKLSKEIYPGIKLMVINRYVNQTSKDIRYNQLELTSVFDNFKFGYAIRHVDEIPSHRIIAGYKLDKAITGITRLTAKLNINSDLETIDMDSMIQFDISLMKFFNVYIFGKNEKLGNKNYFQFKTGISIEIPQWS